MLAEGGGALALPRLVPMVPFYVLRLHWPDDISGVHSGLGRELERNHAEEIKRIYEGGREGGRSGPGQRDQFRPGG